MSNNIYNLANNLQGLTVGKWYVKQKLKHESSTGGNFSVGYEVANTDDNSIGFLKALDYTSAFESNTDTAKVLNAMTEAYIFECNLLNKCAGNRLRYVVRIIDSGEYNLPEEMHQDKSAFYPPVNYIVLEMADNSMRNIIDLSKAIDYSWILRSLHNIAVAIDEMHGILIAHQDIKPSNVLLFNEQKRSKLTDVGRSSSLDFPAEHDNLLCAGDLSYSPFEQLYGFVEPDFKMRRYACDMFMFGNLIMTCFNGISVTTSVLNNIPKQYWPKNWTDSYESILPLLEKSFSECLESFNNDIDSDLRNELVNMIKQLCSPNPEFRGDLKNKKHRRFSMTRYISKLDLLANKYEYQLKKVLR